MNSISALLVMWCMKRHSDPSPHPSAYPQTPDALADAIRLTADQLRAIPSPDTKLFTALAFVMTRVANADERITCDETARMESLLVECARLTPAQAALVAEVAAHRARLADAGCAYAESRHLRLALDATRRFQLLECLHSVANADGELSDEERSTIFQVAAELGFTRDEIAAAGPQRDA